MGCRFYRYISIPLLGSVLGNNPGSMLDSYCLSGNIVPNSRRNWHLCRCNHLQHKSARYSPLYCKYRFRHLNNPYRCTVMVYLLYSMAQNHWLVTQVLLSSSFIYLSFLCFIDTMLGMEHWSGIEFPSLQDISGL